jgi:hypothetical protein
VTAFLLAIWRIERLLYPAEAYEIASQNGPSVKKIGLSKPVCQPKIQW